MPGCVCAGDAQLEMPADLKYDLDHQQHHQKNWIREMQRVDGSLYYVSLAPEDHLPQCNSENGYLLSGYLEAYDDD